MTVAMKNGAMVEVGTIGDEGMVGINAFFGGDMVSGETMMQVPDTDAEVMSAKVFTREMAPGGRSGMAYNATRRRFSRC